MNLLGRLRSATSFGGNDLTYEEQVIADCNHEWEKSVQQTDRVYDVRVAEGYLIVQVFEKVLVYCTFCGVENAKRCGDRPGKKFASEIDLEIDREVTIEEATYERLDDLEGGRERRVVVSRSEN